MPKPRVFSSGARDLARSGKSLSFVQSPPQCSVILSAAANSRSAPATQSKDQYPLPSRNTTSGRSHRILLLFPSWHSDLIVVIPSAARNPQFAGTAKLTCHPERSERPMYRLSMADGPHAVSTMPGTRTQRGAPSFRVLCERVGGSRDGTPSDEAISPELHVLRSSRSPAFSLAGRVIPRAVRNPDLAGCPISRAFCAREVG